MCKTCNNTGSRPGSSFLDCVACDNATILAAFGDWHSRHSNATPAEIFQHGREVERAAAPALPAAEQPADERQAAALSEMQKYRAAYGDGVRAAAKLCDEKYRARVESGHPREASTARSLAEEIRNLQSTGPVAAPALPAAAQPASIDTPEFRKAVDRYQIAEEEYALDKTQAKFDAAGDSYEALVTFINRWGAALATPAPESQPAAQWISVDERLPEQDGGVLIAYWPYDNRQNARVVEQAHYTDGSFLTWENGDEHHPPSHWMPIPPIPAVPAMEAQRHE